MRQTPLTLPSRRIFCCGATAVSALAVASWPRGPLAQTGAAGDKLKIATIGAGREGSALGGLFVKAGHPVMFSSRHPEQLKEMVEGLGPLAKAGTTAEAVAFGDVVLLIVPYTAVAEIGKEHGPGLAKKQLVHRRQQPDPAARRRGVRQDDQ